MHERYEMVERVYYHHKKAALSTMLAKRVEISGKFPSESNDIYPAPWDKAENPPTHMCHFTDAAFIEYVCNLPIDGKMYSSLASALKSGLMYARNHVYRTLLVVDCDLIRHSKKPLQYWSELIRGMDNKPDSIRKAKEKRNDWEKQLSEEAKLSEGDVLIYFPRTSMQSKEVDVRIEIMEKRYCHCGFKGNRLFIIRR